MLLAKASLAALVLGAVLAFPAFSAFASDGGTLLNSFESKDDLKWLKANGTKLSLVAEGVTEGAQALRVEFGKSQWPNVYFAPRTPWDWSGTGLLVMDITNPGTESVPFSIRVDDDKTADGVKHCRTGGSVVPAGKTVTFCMGVSRDAMDLGMRGLPPSPYGTDIGSSGSGDFNPAHIVAFQVFMQSPKNQPVLIIDNARVIANTIPKGVVDEFGQYAKADWPGKLKSVAGFPARRKAEETDLYSKPVLPGRNRYGGWADGPKQKATGYFRTERVDGKWWLVDPEGRLFFSMGVDCVSDAAETMVTGREDLFSWLPETGNPLWSHFGHVDSVHSGPVLSGDTFNFYRANLERKYGAGYHDTAMNIAVKRLKSWGFNTVGNWSDSSLYGNGRLPYVATSGVGGSHARISSGNDYWGAMHDPFDPQFILDARTMAQELYMRVNNDPWCLGVFVDNELSWGGMENDRSHFGLALSALASTPSASSAKRALLKELKAKYADITGLNAAWKTSYTGWEQLDTEIKPKEPFATGLRDDLSAFTKTFAKRYFTVIRDELKKVMPNHLYLGCRFAWKTDEAIAAAAEVCDVVGFNIYASSLDPKAWDFAKDLGKPCIIGEFHFGALDRGMFHTGLVAAASQEERARMYESYVNSVLDHPAFVGCHWFQYLDEPLTGRSFDGENYNIGFVTVTDTPYPEMVDAARSVHAGAYGRRFKGVPEK